MCEIMIESLGRKAKIARLSGHLLSIMFFSIFRLSQMCDHCDGHLKNLVI
jgi:hypothetical protein